MAWSQVEVFQIIDFDIPACSTIGCDIRTVPRTLSLRGRLPVSKSVRHDDSGGMLLQRRYHQCCRACHSVLWAVGSFRLLVFQLERFESEEDDEDEGEWQ